MSVSNHGRRALGLGVLAALGAAVPLPVRAAPRARTVRRPPRLREGDTVALVTPSGHIDAVRLARAVDNLASLGLRAKLGRHVREQRGNFAGTPEQRLEDLRAALADPGAAAVWAIHGGAGAMALLPHLDYRALRARPKAVIGFSDVTALLLAVHRQAGLVTYHAPNAGSIWTEYTRDALRATLMEGRYGTPAAYPAEQLARAHELPHLAPRTVRGGIAEGPLMGGNLSLVAALAGSPYGADLRGALVFLEDVNEAPYRLDRMLRQLRLGASLERAAGVALGVFEKCGPPDSDPSLTLAETLDEHFAGLPAPCAYGLPFGHVREQCVLPLGVRARLDAGSGALTLLEAPVA